MSTSEQDNLLSPTRQILRETFHNQPPSTHTTHWESLWQKSLTPWDRSGPSLALKDAILNNPDIFGPPITSSQQQGKRKRALVPGCGRGYDVHLLSCLGYDTIGIDASKTALAAAEELTQTLTSHPDPIYLPPAEMNINPGTATFLLADFFQPLPQEETFDLIFDYTFLCALPPSLRPSWSSRISSLLTPGTGRLICLEWPLHKSPNEGGPPHGVSGELYEELLGRPGEELEYDGEGRVVVSKEDEEEGKGGLERVGRWMPERTHEAGRGRDFVSVWRRRRLI